MPPLSSNLAFDILFSILSSVGRGLGGFALAVLVGIPLGILTRKGSAIWVGLQSLPAICWSLLVLKLLGQGVTAVFLVVIAGSLPGVVLATQSALKAVTPLQAKVAQVFGEPGIAYWTKVALPAGLPTLVTGLRGAWGLAWRGLMTAEVVSGGLKMGLGVLLDGAKRRDNNLLEMVLLTLAILILGMLVDRLVFGTWEQRLKARYGGSYAGY
jgi:ABC-type nitrate/sulfonate/bicarbonate transport system permease component